MAEAVTTVRAKEPTTLARVQTENIFERADAMFDAIARRAFELFEGDSHTFGRDVENWLQAEEELLHPLHLDLTETGEGFEVKAEVPGFTEKELQINVEARRVAISGKREEKKEEKKGKTIHSETCSDQIMRVVQLPADVDTEKATATLKNGILELHLPKAAPARSIRIETKAAG
jgi:HSP20 family protein